MEEEKVIKILVIEDSTADAFIIDEYLHEIEEQEFDSQHVESLSEGEALIESESFDIVLIDLNLPDSSGPDHYKIFFKKYSYIPFIIMTGLASKEISLNMIKHGAKDYLVKGDFDANLLHRSIIYALERKRIEDQYIQELMLAQDKEKERIARDVHDSLGQNLTSASIQIQNLKSELKDCLGAEYEDIEESVEIALECVNRSQEISRGISRNLMPQTVKKFGLVSGIEGILMTLNDHKLQIGFESNLDGQRFDSTIELAYFRIAQESINNIIKYSEANEASIKLFLRDHILSLQISDEGVGFDPYDETISGVGLESIKARAKAISAKLEIISEKGEGSTIRVIKDIKDEQED